MLAPWKVGYDKPRQHIKKQRHHFAKKCLYCQIYGFTSSHVQMWYLEHKEGWVVKNNAFELWWWRRFLRASWAGRRWNQSVLNIHWKDCCWCWSTNSLANWCKEPIHCKRPWYWEKLKEKGKRGARGRGEWKSWLKTQHSENEDHGIWPHHFMANRWGKNGTDFSSGGSKITADGDCSHESKRHLLLGRKAMTNLDSILKSRDITLPTKVRLVKAMVFPVVMYGCESWTIKKAECWRIDAFELWCWGILLRVPWTARRSNQSILKKISPEYSLEGLMLKLKFQNFGHLMRRTDSLEKTLMLGEIEGGGKRDSRWWDGWMASLTQWRWAWASSRR